MEMQSHQIIRSVERDVLDRVHLINPIFVLPQEIALARVVKVFGDTMRDLLGNVHIRGYAQWVKSLGHCIRWIHAHCPNEGVAKDPTWEQQDKNAADLLEWGTVYAQLFDDHVAWTRKFISADVDVDKRTITFGDQNQTYHFVVDQQKKDERLVERESAEIYECTDAIFSRWRTKVKWGTNGLVYPPEFIPALREINDLHRWSRSLILPELQDLESIGKYTVGDLRRFHTCLRALCSCISRLEEEEDQAHGPVNKMGSWIFAQHYTDAIKWFHRGTGLSPLIIAPIIADLSIDASRTHCSILSSPFIPTRCGKIIFSPRLFEMAHPHRMILSALTTGSGRHSYDAISGKVEQWWIKKVESLFREWGMQVYTSPKFRFPEGMKNPDLLIVDESLQKAYVIEFKNHTPPLDIRTVCNRISDFNNGLVQIRGYVEGIAKHRAIVAKYTGRPVEGFSICGLLLFRHPVTLPISLPSDILICDWATLENYFRNNRSSIAASFLDSLSLSQTEVLEFTEHTIRVQRWKYRRILPVRPKASE